MSSPSKLYDCDKNREGSQDYVPVRKGDCDDKMNYIRGENVKDGYCVKNECMDKQDIQIARLRYMNPDTTPDTRKRIMPLRNPGDFKFPFGDAIILSKDVEQAGIGDPTQDIMINDDYPIEQYIEDYRKGIEGKNLRESPKSGHTRYKTLVEKRDAKRKSVSVARARKAEQASAERKVREEARRKARLDRSQSRRLKPDLPPENPVRFRPRLNTESRQSRPRLNTESRQSRPRLNTESRQSRPRLNTGADSFYDNFLNNISPISGEPIYEIPKESRRNARDNILKPKGTAFGGTRRIK